jgi:hypothetical protein
MSVDGAVQDITRREARGSRALWFGVFAPPSAWALQLIVNYSLEEWFACAPSTQEPGRVVGMTVDAFALIITTALVLVALIGLGISYRCHRKLRAGDRVGESLERARWMALAGILNGILYTIIIIASYGVPAILDTCRSAP